MRIANRSNHPINATFGEDIHVSIEPGEAVELPAGKPTVRIDESPQEVGRIAHPAELARRHIAEDHDV